MNFHSIIFFFLSLGLTLNTFGAVNSEKTRFPASESSENEELVREFEEALIKNESATVAFHRTDANTSSVGNAGHSAGNTISSDNFSVDKDENPGNYYFSLGGGIINFPDVGNIQMFNGAGGIGLGISLTSRLKLEAGFIYSFQQIEINQLVNTVSDDIDQYSFNAKGVYHWDVSWPVTPITGVMAGLTSRQYNDDEGSSNAFDVGLVFGIDKPVSPGLSFGLEYRYMINVDYKREFENSNYGMMLQNLATSAEVNPLETFDYQVVFLNTKFNF